MSEGERKDRLSANERAEAMMNDMYWDGYEDGRADRGATQGPWNTGADGYPKRFRRNKIDGVFGGVCAGIGDYIGWDPLLVRIVFLGLVLFLGFPFFIYFLLWIFVPSDKRAPYYREAREAIREARRDARAEAGATRRAVEIARSYRPTTNLTDVRSKFQSIETRMQDLERSITSKEFQLRRDFKDLED